MSLKRREVLSVLDAPRVSLAIRKALRLAQQANTADLERWCRLELGGYYASNSAMGEDITVPEYRSVVGQHLDIHGRVLMVEPNMAFVNETRLRNSVEELEVLADTHQMVSLHDPDMCQLLREHLHVDVYVFQFSVVHLAGVLSAIRTEVEERVAKLDPSTTAEEDPREEVLIVRPNIHGLGIDLRALWRRWRRCR